MPAAMVCGSKRSYGFDEQFPSSPLSKKSRYSSSLSPGSSLHHLKSLFPQADAQLLENVLKESGNDLDCAIRSFHKRFVGRTKHDTVAAGDAGKNLEQGTFSDERDAAALKNELAPGNFPADGAEWVELFVMEMRSAASIDDARARASRALGMFEKSVNARAAGESAQSFQQENILLKEKIEVLIRENTILKKAVAIQHERQREFEDKNRELQQLKQLLSQYQERLRTLEVNNYGLMMRLRQAQQSSPIPGHFHPDVF